MLKKGNLYEKIFRKSNFRDAFDLWHQLLSGITGYFGVCGNESDQLFDIRNPWNSWGCTALWNYGIPDFIEIAQK